jgi:glycosyltransferase involved in cell wall biosynthesis
MGPAVTHVLALAEKPDRVVFGGAERHLRLLLPALSRRGMDVEAIVLATSPGAVVEEALAEWRAAGVSVRVIARRSLGGRLANLPGFLLQHARLARALVAHRERIVHLHLDLFFMPLAAFLAGCRDVVMTLHNEVLVPEGRSARRLLDRWLAFLARRVARFIAISERVAEHFEALTRIAPERIDVVEYGLEVGPSAGESRERRGWPADRFLVGFVGRLVPEKNVFVLLEAAAQCPDLDVAIVGDGPLRAEVEQRIAELRLHNIRLAGAVEGASALVPLFDVLCLPSRWEGLGLVLVEAMLLGVPVIGSRSGAIPDVLGHGRYGLLFDTDDASDLARALRQARGDEAGMRSRADRARGYARERFSVAAMAERTEAVYDRVLERDEGVALPGAASDPMRSASDASHDPGSSPAIASRRAAGECSIA